MNLLSNASKFTSEGGNITIHVIEQADVFKVQVSDTGIGIKPEDLERIFQPFASIQKNNYIKGTGLGLSITKGLVEAHGGKISAESAGEGKGAVFTFIIPKRRT
jgi:signal transduction histidine kinase